jgi:hypothetical protein
MKYMTIIATITLFIIFLLLSILHFSWAFGSRWGYDIALPRNEAGQRMLNPKAVDCIVVGMGLLLFAGLYLSHLYSELVFGPTILYQIGDWAVPIIFLLRAIGDFKYVGFFKRIRNSDFAKADSYFFSPLCLLLSGLGFWVLWAG